MSKVFVSCAVTGSGDTAKMHPDLPKLPEQIANEVNEKVQGLGKDNIPTKTIGEFILKALKEKDKIGYVRFYGVFKKVNDPKEYKRIVDTLH